MEQEIALSDLLYEYIVVSFQLLWRYRILVGIGLSEQDGGSHNCADHARTP
jgi:hypothetical protein